MQAIEVESGEVFLVDRGSRMVAEYTPAPDHFWVSLGYVHQDGLLINSHEWDAFVKMVNGVDQYIKENVNG